MSCCRIARGWLSAASRPFVLLAAWSDGKLHSSGFVRTCWLPPRRQIDASQVALLMPTTTERR